MLKVTVIIPVYNVELYLQRCLDSVLNQTYTNYEIICVDDCSSDGSQQILNNYAQRNPSRISVLLNRKNVGQGRSRDRAIAQSKGEYILFVDSDDYIKENYIETYMMAMEKDPCDLIIAGYTRDVDGKLKQHKAMDSIWSVITYPIPCAKLYRKEFIVQNHIGFSDIRCGEDIYFSLCVFYYNPSYRVIDYSGYYYYFNRKSTTGSMNYEKNHEEFVAQIFSTFMKMHDVYVLPIFNQRIIEYAYVANMINALITYGHGAKVGRMKMKYNFFIDDLQKKFPDYRKNPYFGLMRPSGQTLKIHLGVGITMLLHKVHLDKLMFCIISFI